MFRWRLGCVSFWVKYKNGRIRKCPALDRCFSDPERWCVAPEVDIFFYRLYFLPIRNAMGAATNSIAGQVVTKGKGSCRQYFRGSGDSRHHCQYDAYRDKCLADGRGRLVGTLDGFEQYPGSGSDFHTKPYMISIRSHALAILSNRRIRISTFTRGLRGRAYHVRWGCSHEKYVIWNTIPRRLCICNALSFC